MHKKCQCKNTMQNKYKSKIIYRKFKNTNCRKCFWTSAWFTFRGRAGYAVSGAWFSCIQVLEFASHSICASMSFSPVWVSVPASTLDWAHRFSRKGWWLARPPSPSPKRCFSRKRGPISQGMTLPTVHLFRFFCICIVSVVVVVLLYCCCIVVVLLLYCCCIVFVLFLYCFLIVFVLFFIVS
jgi:Flp pilus assembly protein TadB